jgi:catechol 2,3-dioxygenase-like lactoylglutathione lyase family enzyme
MSIELNHFIIEARDKRASAEFLAGILGLQAGPEWAIFVPVRLGNGVTLDYAEASEIPHQHCAFLVSEAEFDAALARIRSAGVEFYADYDRSGRGEINHLYGGRGVYFYDPNGHLFELITQPYGPVPEKWSDTVASGRAESRSA